MSSSSSSLQAARLAIAVGMLCALCLAVMAAPKQMRQQMSPMAQDNDGQLDGAESEDVSDADWNSDDERELAGIDSAANSRNDEDARDDLAASNQVNSFGRINAEPELDADEPNGSDSNIENAKVELGARDMATAAGHHHHHKHYVHGWLKMGAHTGKKGSFGWHDKHPVGGKGKK